LDTGNKYQIASIKGINNENVLSENSFFGNTLVPSVTVAYSGMDKLEFKAKLDFPFSLFSGKETGMIIKTGSLNGELEKNGDEISTVAFQFSPVLNIAIQYQAFREKLNLNIGGEIQFATITIAASNKYRYTNYGEWKPDVFPGLDSVLGLNQSSRLFAGLTFFFNDKVLLDVMTGLNSENTDNNFNIFGISGNSLTSFSGILLSLKI